MNKILLVILILTASCTASKKSKKIDEDRIASTETIATKDESQANDTYSIDEAEFAKRWLIDAIDRQFNNELHDFKLITTGEYFGLKSDLINSNYEHGIDLDSIRKKWSYKYAISAEDIGVGFLIDAQDNGQIEVESCKLLNTKVSSSYLFRVSLYDTLFKTHHKSDITVVPYNGSYAIDYVREHWK